MSAPNLAPRLAILPTLRTATQTLFIGPAIWHDTPMTTISIDKAQKDLAILVKRAVAGEDIIIESDDMQVRLLPVPRGFDAVTARRRGYGLLKGKLVVGPEFFEPLSDEECGLVQDNNGGS
jgi:antitoxin (DNA-binding transcriptional repressor) of toxin-antitoxin stability system